MRGCKGVDGRGEDRGLRFHSHEGRKTLPPSLPSSYLDSHGQHFVDVHELFQRHGRCRVIVCMYHDKYEEKGKGAGMGMRERKRGRRGKEREA